MMQGVTTMHDRMDEWKGDATPPFAPEVLGVHQVGRCVRRRGRLIARDRQIVQPASQSASACGVSDRASASAVTRSTL